MIDSMIFRRCNSNYSIFTLKHENKNILSDSESENNDEFKDSSDEKSENHTSQFNDEKKKSKLKKNLIKNEKIDIYHLIDVSINEEDNVIQKENIKNISSQNNFDKREFTDEKYLITSSIALDFSFDEKLWLEFAIFDIQDVTWNESIFDSLVILNKHKHVIKSLVELHEQNAKKNINDIIQD